MEYLYSLTVALFLTIALIPLLIRLSAHLGLVDDPSAERKVHKTVMPRTGGLGIIIGCALPLLFALQFEGYVPWLFLGFGVIVVFGLLDDRLELPFYWKLFGQGLAAVLVMYGGIAFEQMPFFGLEAAPAWLSYTFTFFFLVGVVNGVNFSDGMDGLAAGTSILALLLIFILAIQADNVTVALIALTIIGGALGFLRYNTFPANIFMGDTGSQFLGFAIACLAILVSQGDVSPYSRLLPILILGIPIMDILQVVPVRIHKKLPLPGPDREHFHHQIAKLGFRHTEVVAIIYVLQTVLMVAAYLLCYERDFTVAAFYAAFVACVLGALLAGHLSGWQVRPLEQGPVAERRNSLLRRLAWYYRNSARFLAHCLGLFFLGVAVYFSRWGGLLPLAGIVCLGGLLAYFSRGLSPLLVPTRVVLYSASVFCAFWVVGAEPASPVMRVVVAYIVFLVLALVLAIRMTRRQVFSLTTQDLLILLLILLLPQLPFDFIDRYSVGSVALIVAVLLYTSEFVLMRGTRMALFASTCAVGSMVLILLAEI